MAIKFPIHGPDPDDEENDHGSKVRHRERNPGYKELGAPRSGITALSLWALDHLQARRQRGRYFPESFFRDPAWDLLLDLYIAEAEDHPVRVTSACRAAAQSTTTGLRWVNILEEAGLVLRIPDSVDGRAAFLRLTDDGWARMETYIQEMRSTEYAYFRDKSGHLRLKRVKGGKD